MHGEVISVEKRGRSAMGAMGVCVARGSLDVQIGVNVWGSPWTGSEMQRRECYLSGDVHISGRRDALSSRP